MHRIDTCLQILIDEYYTMFKGRINAGIQQCSDEVEQVIEYFGDRKFKNMAESGVDYGGSFWLYANLFLEEGGTFTVVDPVIKPVVREIAAIIKERKNANINILEKRSTETNLSELDFIHIDGDHDFKSVMQDFGHYYDNVIDGGVILMHDTLLHEGAIRARSSMESSGMFNMRTFKGFNLISGNFGVPGENLSTGITLVQK